MENFLKLFLDRDIFYSLKKVSDGSDGSSSSNFIKFLQKIIFKHDVMVEFEEILKSACSSESFTVKNDMIKKLIVALNSVLSSDIDSKSKVDIFSCIFQTFIKSCKENERLPAVQFFAVLTHLLGLDKFSDKNVEDSCIVNAENFKNAFNVEIFAPSEVSYVILRELLVWFSKHSLIQHSGDKSVYYKWLQKLIRKLANTQPLKSIFLEIFSIFIDVELKLVEKNIECIIGSFLSQKPPVDEDINKSYGSFLEYGLKMSTKFQRTTKFVKNFLLGVKASPTKLSEEAILPFDFMTEFSKTVGLLSSQQSMSLLDLLMVDLVECYTAITENHSESQLLFTTSTLLIEFLKEVKIFTPNISANTLHMIIDKLASLNKTLQEFGSYLLGNKDYMVENENIIRSHLQLCLYCEEVQALIECYKDSVLSPTELGNSTPEDCLSSKQWKSLVKFVLKTNMEVCYPVCLQLALHKLRTLRLSNSSLAEESTLKMIQSQFELDTDKFNLFQKLSPEDVTIIISFLTPDQTKVIVEKIFDHILNAETTDWKCWLCDSNLQENLSFVVNLLSALLKKTGSVLNGGKIYSKFSWLSDDYLDGAEGINKEYLEHLPKKINKVLKSSEKIQQSLGKNFNQQKDIIRIFEVFKLLPVNHLKDYSNLGLSFAVAVGVILSHDEDAICLPLESMCSFLASDVDASICFDVGLCLKWLCELVFDKKETNDLKVKVIECLVRSCPNTKFGLSQMGGMIEVSETLKKDSSMKVLETKVILYQELGKCWQRAKKRQADNDMIGSFRTKLARVISDEAKDLENVEILPENCKLLFRIFSIELQKAVKMKSEEEISVLIEQRFPSFFRFAVKTLSKAYDEASASFLTFILSLTPQLKKFLPPDTFLKIWKSLQQYEKGNWKHFCSHSDDDEFNVISSDLLQLSKNFLTPQLDQHSSNCFEIWQSFFEFSSESKRQTCQLLLQDLFRFAHDCELSFADLPIKKRICLIKFYSFCVSSGKVILTSHMLDTIIHVMVEFLDDSSPVEDFRNLFVVEVDTALAILLKQFLWSKNKIHLSFVLFKRLLGSLAKRSDVTVQVNHDDVIMLSTCAFVMEKWVKLMVKKKMDFARTAPFFITTIISAIASTTILPAIKFYLINCINHFLSICDSHAVSYLMRVLKPGYQQVFNSIYNQFKKYHKYTGKI